MVLPTAKRFHQVRPTYIGDEKLRNALQAGELLNLVLDLASVGYRGSIVLARRIRTDRCSIQQPFRRFTSLIGFKDQLKALDRFDSTGEERGIDGLAGILLTHAHIGHYTGLMHLEHEAIGAKNVPIYAMPRMADFFANVRAMEPTRRLQEYQIARPPRSPASRAE